MSTEETTTTSSPPIPLSELAVEVGETIDALAHRLGKAVFVDSIGRRAVTRFTASEVIREHRAREARSKATAARNSKRTKAAVERAHARIGSGIEALTLGFATVNVNPAPAAAVMMAQEPPPSYDGSVSTPRPSRLDWLTGKGESAGTFGPSPRQVRADAEEKKRGKVHRLQQKGGGK